MKRFDLFFGSCLVCFLLVLHSYLPIFTRNSLPCFCRCLRLPLLSYFISLSALSVSSLSLLCLLSSLSLSLSLSVYLSPPLTQGGCLIGLFGLPPQGSYRRIYPPLEGDDPYRPFLDSQPPVFAETATSKVGAALQLQDVTLAHTSSYIHNHTNAHRRVNMSFFLKDRCMFWFVRLST